MRTLEELLKENNLKDPEDINALLELAEITGQLICDERYADIELLINYTVSDDYYEAFTWIMAALQEEFEKKGKLQIEGLYLLYWQIHHQLR